MADGAHAGLLPPSIYKHLPDKQALENTLISAAFEEQAATIEAALADPDRIGAIARAYRHFVRRHPHLYRLMTERRLDRDRLVPGAEDSAARPVVEAFGDRDLARAWAFAHGMTILELNDRFPADADLDAAWPAVSLPSAPRLAAYPGDEPRRINAVRRAFDQHLVGVDPTCRVRVARRLLDDEDGPMLELLKTFDGAALQIPTRTVWQPSREGLALRYARFLERSA